MAINLDSIWSHLLPHFGAKKPELRPDSPLVQEMLYTKKIIAPATRPDVLGYYDDALKALDYGAKARTAATAAFQKDVGIKADGAAGQVTIYALELAKSAGRITPEVREQARAFANDVRENGRNYQLADGTRLAANLRGEVPVEIKSSGGCYVVNGHITKIKMGRPGHDSFIEAVIAGNEVNTGKGKIGSQLPVQYGDGTPTLNGGIAGLFVPVRGSSAKAYLGTQELIDRGVQLQINGKESVDFAVLKSNRQDLTPMHKNLLLKCAIQGKLEQMVDPKVYGPEFFEQSEETQNSLLSFNYNVDVGRTHDDIKNAVKNGDNKALAGALSNYIHANGKVEGDLILRRKLDVALLHDDRQLVTSIMKREKSVFDENIAQERMGDRSIGDNDVQTSVREGLVMGDVGGKERVMRAMLAEGPQPETAPKAEPAKVMAQNGAARPAINIAGADEAVHKLEAAAIRDGQVITPENAKLAKYEVSAINNALNTAGYHVKVTSSLSKETLAAISDFKTRSGMENPGQAVIDEKLTNNLMDFLKGKERNIARSEGETGAETAAENKPAVAKTPASLPKQQEAKLKLRSFHD